MTENSGSVLAGIVQIDRGLMERMGLTQITPSVRVVVWHTAVDVTDTRKIQFPGPKFDLPARRLITVSLVRKAKSNPSWSLADEPLDGTS